MSARPGLVPAAGGYIMFPSVGKPPEASPLWGLVLTLAEIAERVERRRAAEFEEPPSRSDSPGKEKPAGVEPAGGRGR